MATLFNQDDILIILGKDKKALRVKLSEDDITSRELIKKHTFSSVANKYFGETVETNLEDVIPLDVSKYDEISVYIKNNTDQNLIPKFHMFIVNEKNGVNIETPNLTSQPAGEGRFYNNQSNELSLLNEPYLGLAIKVSFGSAGTGSYDIYFLGKRK